MNAILPDLDDWLVLEMPIDEQIQKWWKAKNGKPLAPGDKNWDTNPEDIKSAGDQKQWPEELDWQAFLRVHVFEQELFVKGKYKEYYNLLVSSGNIASSYTQPLGDLKRTARAYIY